MTLLSRTQLLSRTRRFFSIRWLGLYNNLSFKSIFFLLEQLDNGGNPNALHLDPHQANLTVSLQWPNPSTATICEDIAACLSVSLSSQKRHKDKHLLVMLDTSKRACSPCTLCGRLLTRKQIRGSMLVSFCKTLINDYTVVSSEDVVRLSSSHGGQC